MSFGRKYFLYTVVLLFLLFAVNPTKALLFISDGKNMNETVEKYFPHENNLCVVLAESDKQEFLPPIFHLPLVVFTMNHVLQHCGRKLADQDGYVFIASNNVSLEKQIVPLLKCFNRTTSKLKTKYILVLVVFEDNNSNYCKDYSNFFQNLWNVFGIINIAILPVKGKRLGTNPRIIFSYNPFLTRRHSSPSALKTYTLCQDIRGIMTDRFRNMHGQRLKAVFRYSGSTNQETKPRRGSSNIIQRGS